MNGKSAFFSFILLMFFEVAFCQRLDYVQGQFIVKFVDETAKENFVQKHIDVKKNHALIAPRVQLLCNEPWKIYTIDIDFTQQNEVEYLQVLKNTSEIEYVQRNRIGQNRSIPNDPLFDSQWQYINTGTNGGVVDADIDADAAWNITTGGVTASGDSIVVAVIDDGYAKNHPDLKDNLWVNPDEINGDGIDNDNNGFIDDINGWNFKTNDQNILTGLSHGTSVAGIIGAKGNNGVGVTGVNWNVKILPVVYKSITEAAIIQSYSYVYSLRRKYNITNGQEGAFIVATNSSWGVDNGNAEEAKLWCNLYDEMGAIGILSFGAGPNQNYNVDVVGDLPTTCHSDYLVAVTNMNRTNKKVNVAGYGAKHIDIGAYGSETFTTNNNNYSAFGGTSAATPHATGVAALMYSVPCVYLSTLSKTDPGAAALLVKDLILNTGKSNSSLLDITTTGSVLNAANAVKAVNDICSSCQPTINHKVQTDVIGKATFSWTASPNTTVKIQFKKANGSIWETVQTTDQSITVNNIDICSDYIYRVISVCNGVESLPGHNRWFTTGGCCKAIEDITLTPTDVGFSIMNNEHSGTETTKLVYRLLNSTEWDSTQFIASYNLSNLLPCSLYEFYLVRNCTEVGTSSENSKKFLVSTKCGECTNNDYCLPLTINNKGEWIHKVTINQLENISGQDANGYGPYTGSIVPKLTQTKRYPLKVEAGYSTTFFNERYYVHIDFNQNHAFEDNEKVLSIGQGTNEGLDTMITIPIDALPGITRMRIQMSFDELGSSCESYRFGETEDYCVEIVSKDVATEDELTQFITIQPNPSGDLFHILSNTTMETTIYTTTGNKLFSTNAHTIDLSLYPAGVYIFSIKNSNQKIINTRVVKI